MGKVKKAVIPTAGVGTRHYPASSALKKGFFPVVGTDGVTRPVIQFIVEEAIDSGIEEVCIVCREEDIGEYEGYFRSIPDRLLPYFEGKEWALSESGKLERLGRTISYVVQEEQEGLGHAVYCASEWVGDEPFIVFLGDHVFISQTESNCTAQLIKAFEFCNASVASVHRVPAEQLHLFGTVAGRPVEDYPRLYEVNELVEKPSTSYAKKHMRIKGIREGMYLSFFGIHLFTPGIFDCLCYEIEEGIRERGEFQLTTAQEILRKRSRQYFALEIEGKSYDTGNPFKLIEAEIGLALSGIYRDKVLEFLGKLGVTK